MLGTYWVPEGKGNIHPHKIKSLSLWLNSITCCVYFRISMMGWYFFENLSLLRQRHWNVCRRQQISLQQFNSLAPKRTEYMYNVHGKSDYTKATYNKEALLIYPALQEHFCITYLITYLLYLTLYSTWVSIDLKT